MSTDKPTLAAVAHKTKSDLRYIDFVKVSYLGGNKKCYIGVGRHAIFLLKKTMNGLMPGGKIYFAHITKVVEDTNSSGLLLIQMNSNAPQEWGADHFYLLSENRNELIKQLAISWQADYCFRVNKMRLFPKFQSELSDFDPFSNEHINVCAYSGYKQVSFGNYNFLIPDNFQGCDLFCVILFKGVGVIEGSMGTYRSPIGVEVKFHVHDPVAICHLEDIGRDCIRWVALEYKKYLTKGLDNFYVFRNEAHMRKCDLLEDIASWQGWELFVKSETHAVFCIILRRQYVPPLMNTCQDISVMYRVPMRLLKDKELSDDSLRNLTAITANSCCPCAQVGMYKDLVQARMDCLAFNEDSMAWFKAYHGIEPKFKEQAMIFVKSVINLLPADQGTYAEILQTKAWRAVPTVSDPLQVIQEHFLKPMQNSGGRNMEADAKRNIWIMRVARYLAYCLDGGMCGQQFSFVDIVDQFGSAFLPSEQEAYLRRVIEFLIHIRNADMTRPFFHASITTQMKDPSFSTMIYNDRVVQALMELGYFQKLTGRGKADEYMFSLGNLLVSETASLNLKSRVCRNIIQVPNLSASDADALIPALVESYEKGHAFVATYVAAVLINISHQNDHMKNKLMQRGLGQFVVKHLRSRDDDLVQYTLALCVNITKSVHHRATMVSYGAVTVLMDLLSSNYTLLFKNRLLRELVVVIGQLCNDEEYRLTFARPENPVVDCLLYIFDYSDDLKNPLRSKSVFALKQICGDDGWLKSKIGHHICSTVMSDVTEILDSTAHSSDKVEPVQLEYLNYSLAMFVHIVVINDLAASLSRLGFTGLLRKFITYSKLTDPMQEKLSTLVDIMKKHSGVETEEIEN